MDPNPEWPDVMRVAWIAGGLVATNEPGPKVYISAGRAGHVVYQFLSKAYASIFEALEQRGFPILGVTFVMDAEELQGLRPPDFRVMSRNRGWLAWDLAQKWHQIAFEAGKNGDMPLMDVASRITCGLRYSQMRLYDLARAYAIQLASHLHAREPSEYQAFKDANNFEVYKGIHALFWEMAVLRDALAEFAAVACFSRTGVKTMNGLRKSLARCPSTDPLAQEIVLCTDDSSCGWLATFTSYRNFFTHIAPLEQAADIGFAVQDIRKLTDELSVPQIYYALPENIQELTRRRAGGNYFNSLQELSAASFRRHTRSSEPDALEYLHGCINRFAELALSLVVRSPIPPKPIHIGPEDLIGPVVIG
jgi:hypothetical protein